MSKYEMEAITVVVKTIKAGQAKTATTPAIKPEIKEIKPGQKFWVDTITEANELVQLGAARKTGKEKGEEVEGAADADLSDEKKAPAKKAAPAKKTTAAAKKAAAADESSDEGDEGDDGEAMV